MIKSKWLFPMADTYVMELFRKEGLIPVTMSQYERYKEWVDGVVFTGGEDVSPFLYGETKHSRTYCNLARDAYENRVFRSLPLNLPKVGICRGGQFLNVMSGGRMFQHVDGHDQGNHMAKDEVSGSTIEVSSTHHQMMRPSDEGWVLLTARESTKLESMDEVINLDNSNMEYTDVEACYYGHTNSFCFQPHPEYLVGKECRPFFWDWMEWFFTKDIEKRREKEGYKL